MNFPQSGGRRPNFQQPGQSGGNRRGRRDAERGYQHFVDRNQVAQWSYEPPPYDPRFESQPDRNRNTKRSDGFKKNIQQKKAEREQAMINSALPRSTTETPPMDEPMYDIGPHTSLTAMRDVHCQNFEFSGFITLIEETYEKLRAIDPRLVDRLPFSLFQHVMCNHLNLTVAERARQNGQNILNQRTDILETLPDYQCIPKSISDYLTHISNTLTGTGIEIKLNLPAIAIPEGDGELSGTFGACNAQSHNVYEAYISPYVTLARVIASRDNNPDYNPLPAVYSPANLLPTRNLLGYGPIDSQNFGMRQRFEGLNFVADDTIEGRYKVNSTACNRVYNILAELKEKFKMVELSRENNPNGLNIMPRLPTITTAANLAFVEVVGPDHPLEIPLHERSVNIYANS